MNKTQKQIMTSKWALVVGHYEKIKHKNNSSFKTVNELCEAFQVNRKDIRKYYDIFGQSLSDLFTKDSTRIYEIVFFGNSEYFISFCTEKTFYPVYFKLIDSESGTQIYNNKDDLFINKIEFSIERTMNLRIEIVLLGEEIKNPQYYNDLTSCVGILIQWRTLN